MFSVWRSNAVCQVVGSLWHMFKLSTISV